MKTILPGAMIGIVGGGQLGRMLILAGRNLGYRFAVMDPDPQCPASAVADCHLCAPYSDMEAMERFADGCDVVTYEFEGLPIEPMRWLEARVTLRPSSEILSVCQNRYREKTFLRDHGLPHVPFEVVHNGDELKSALQRMGTPAVLKTAYFGYDGKGQIKMDDTDVDCHEQFGQLGVPLAIVEPWILHRAECSVIVSRGPDGQGRAFPVAENVHRTHILDRSIVPARLPESVQQEATELAIRIAALLGLEGTLGVEFFVTEQGELIVNELAPRPHNSGHFSMDACVTSQFEQSIRAICGLPLGDPSLKHPVVMLNLMGELWPDGKALDWAALLAQHSRVKLHLYGKQTALPGRKMGHLNCLADSLEQALEQSEAVANALRTPHKVPCAQ